MTFGFPRSRLPVGSDGSLRWSGGRGVLGDRDAPSEDGGHGYSNTHVGSVEVPLIIRGHKVMFSVWVVNHEKHTPVRFVQSFSDPESGLRSATRILQGIGAPGVRASNTAWGDHDKALLVEDISGLLPFAVIVTGVRIEEANGRPIEDAVTGSFEQDTVVYH